MYKADVSDVFLPCSVCGHPDLQSTCSMFGHRNSAALKVKDIKNVREPATSGRYYLSALENSAPLRQYPAYEG